MSNSFCEHVYEAFAAQARRTPQAIAVVDAAHAWTYAELARHARLVAATLRERGVTDGNFVAVEAAHDVRVVGAILGVFAAGAAYVPVDPSYPEERRAWMLRDCAARLLLTVATGPFASEIEVLDVRELVDKGASLEEALPSQTAAAYVIYTSGSSGRPKGVVVEHGSVFRYVRAFGEKLGITPRDRVLQFGSLSFDLSVEEIFGALLHGATLILRDESTLDSMERFVGACDRGAITLLDLPTAWWHELCAALASGLRLPASVRAVVIGGERASAVAVARFHDFAPGVRLFNTYGPTETTIAATWAELQPGATGEPPIGEPVPDALAYVVGPDHRLASDGEPGELWIGGGCLARGYLNQPELTAERFLASPFATGRVYRTGDWVVRRADGQLYYLGRIDQQLKLRGFRVEPGEIEAHVAARAGVAQVAVVVRGNEAGAQLVACYTGAAEPSELVEALRAELPAHLVPTAFVRLPAMPLTPNGKVDRARLSEVRVAPTTSAAYVAPRTDVERALCEMLADLLGLARVSISAAPFELGLDSISAARWIGIVRARLGYELSLRDVFEAQSVEELAARALTASARTAVIPRLRRPS